ncbi:hypothetical protein F8388_026917 [Cannabis sativa]|uniref:Uncharacterized protein n=1 Tax=Cannabis sativa TaxID=3483 RepID=A0A7J6H2U9_CANSA|nr:hypothetical protein F8388_026917 [Cannabis sativa]
MFGRQNEEEEEDCDDDEDEKVYATTRSRSSASTVTSIAYNEQGSIVMLLRMKFQIFFLSILCDFGCGMWNSTENVFVENWEDEEALRWAALERLPTYKRVRRGIFKDVVGDTKEVDVSELESSEQKLLLERLVNAVEDDPDRFFDRMRRRFDASIESFVHVGSRALPTIPNFFAILRF